MVSSVAIILVVPSTVLPHLSGPYKRLCHLPSGPCTLAPQLDGSSTVEPLQSCPPECHSPWPLPQYITSLVDPLQCYHASVAPLACHTLVVPPQRYQWSSIACHSLGGPYSAPIPCGSLQCSDTSSMVLVNCRHSSAPLQCYQIFNSEPVQHFQFPTPQ